MGMKGSSSARWERKLADHCWITVRSGDTPRECERERGRLAPSDCPPRYGSLPRRPREMAIIQSATTHRLQLSLTLPQTVHRRQRRPFPIRRRPPRRRRLRRERPLRGARPARAPSQRPAAQTRRVGVHDGRRVVQVVRHRRAPERGEGERRVEAAPEASGGEHGRLDAAVRVGGVGGAGDGECGELVGVGERGGVWL